MPEDIANAMLKTGIMPVGSGPGQGNLYQAKGALRDAEASTLRLLKLRGELQQHDLRNRAYQQGDSAMRDLSTLDPTSPNYLTQRREVLKRNPYATLNEAFTATLGLQEQEYRAVEADREFQKRETAQKEYLNYRSTLGIAEQDALDRQSAEEKLATYSPRSRQTYQESQKLGLPWREAFNLTNEIEANEQEVLGLLASGFTEEEVNGAVDKNGFLDPRKKAALIGSQVRAKMARGLEDRAYDMDKDKQRQLSYLTRDLDELIDAQSSARKEARPRYDERINEVRAQIDALKGVPSGATTSPAAPATGPLDPVTGQRLAPVAPAKKPPSALDSLFND